MTPILKAYEWAVYRASRAIAAAHRRHSTAVSAAVAAATVPAGMAVEAPAPAPTPGVPVPLTTLAWLLAADERLLLRISSRQVPALTPVMRAFTHLGDWESWTAMSVLLLGARHRQSGWRVAAGAVLATLLSQPLKRVSRRPRPNQRLVGFEALALNPDAFSFPSGHTAAAVAVAVALAGTPVLGPLSSMLAVGIGLSRVYLGAHYPVDVTAGALLGVVAGALVRWWAGAD